MIKPLFIKKLNCAIIFENDIFYMNDTLFDEIQANSEEKLLSVNDELYETIKDHFKIDPRDYGVEVENRTYEI